MSWNSRWQVDATISAISCLQIRLEFGRGIAQRFLEKCECGRILFDQGPLGEGVLPETLEHVGAGIPQAGCYNKSVLHGAS